MAINPVDIEVLDAAWKATKAANQQLNSRTLFSELRNVSEDDFYDSLEILERKGYVKRSREIAPRPPTFSLTSSGILKWLQENGDFTIIQIDVEEAIAKKPDSTEAEIVTVTNHSAVSVAAIFDMLEGRGDIRVRRTLDGNVQIASVSATLRRRVSDSDY
jgi:DNA-binding MarR family transcriptional regulator